jgi:hypothetical protein
VQFYLDSAQAYFSSTEFLGRVSFLNNKLNNFQLEYCTFYKEADFSNVEFYGYFAIFKESEFQGYTNFEKAKFKKADADFTDTTFFTKVNYKESIFNKNLILRNTVFKEQCILRGIQLGKYIDLIGADFVGSVFFDPSKALCQSKKNEPIKLITSGGMISTNDFRRLAEFISNGKIKRRVEMHDILINNLILTEIEGNPSYVKFNESIYDKNKLLQLFKKPMSYTVLYDDYSP